MKFKKYWNMFATLSTILFGIFITIAEVNDNLPKVTNIYRILFPNYTKFSMNSEKSDFFKIQGTINGKYKIDDNFLKIKTQEFALQYDNHTKKNKHFFEKIDYIRIGLGHYIHGKVWEVQIFSEDIKINKLILENGSIIISPKEFLIPIASIKNLDNYWIVLEVGNFKKENNKLLIYTTYTHSKRDIFKSITNH